MILREPRPEPVKRSELGFAPRYVTESKLFGAGLVAGAVGLYGGLLTQLSDGALATVATALSAACDARPGCARAAAVSKQVSMRGSGVSTARSSSAPHRSAHRRSAHCRSAYRSSAHRVRGFPHRSAARHALQPRAARSDVVRHDAVHAERLAVRPLGRRVQDPAEGGHSVHAHEGEDGRRAHKGASPGARHDPDARPPRDEAGVRPRRARGAQKIASMKLRIARAGLRPPGRPPGRAGFEKAAPEF